MSKTHIEANQCRYVIWNFISNVYISKDSLKLHFGQQCILHRCEARRKSLTCFFIIITYFNSMISKQVQSQNENIYYATNLRKALDTPGSSCSR